MTFSEVSHLKGNRARGMRLGHSHPTLGSCSSRFNSNEVHINKIFEINKRETVYILFYVKNLAFFHRLSQKQRMEHLRFIKSEQG